MDHARDFVSWIGMAGRAASFDTTALIDSDVDNYRTWLHTFHHAFGNQDWRFPTRNQHTTDTRSLVTTEFSMLCYLNEVSSDDLGKRRRDILSACDWCRVRRLQHRANRHTSRVYTDNSATNDCHFAAIYAGHTAE